MVVALGTAAVVVGTGWGTTGAGVTLGTAVVVVALGTAAVVVGTGLGTAGAELALGTAAVVVAAKPELGTAGLEAIFA